MQQHIMSELSEAGSEFPIAMVNSAPPIAALGLNSEALVLEEFSAALEGLLRLGWVGLAVRTSAGVWRALSDDESRALFAYLGEFRRHPGGVGWQPPEGGHREVEYEVVTASKRQSPDRP